MQSDKTKVTVNEQQSRAGTLDKSKSRHAITIQRPIGEVFQFWRNIENLATFMKDVREIKVLSPVLSHWIVELQSGLQAEWQAKIINEMPNHFIEWESIPGSDVRTSGYVSFKPAPAGRGTVVSLSMDYAVPGGKLVEWLAYFRGEDPDNLVPTNLKRLKALLETGEFPTVEGQPSGREPNASPVLKH